MLLLVSLLSCRCWCAGCCCLVLKEQNLAIPAGKSTTLVVQWSSAKKGTSQRSPRRSVGRSVGERREMSLRLLQGFWVALLPSPLPGAREAGTR